MSLTLLILLLDKVRHREGEVFRVKAIFLIQVIYTGLNIVDLIVR